MDFDELRRDYGAASLSRSDLPADPYALFGEWMSAAIEAGIGEPHAMALATADADGHPSVRIVLLKSFDAAGFVFSTNYRSRKGRELSENPRAAVAFHWKELERQIRIEGAVERTEPEVSDAIFDARPREAKLAAVASTQSRPVADRAALQAEVARLDELYPDDVPRPDHWGGYRIRPHAIEFWQGGAARMHDRFVYAVGPGAWRIERLAP